MECDFREIARRASLFTRESAARFARSQFPGIEGGVLRGSLDDFQAARNDLVRCRHCKKPQSCPLFGRPMRLVVAVDGEQKIIRAQRVVCSRWKAARPVGKPDAEKVQRRDLD